MVPKLKKKAQATKEGKKPHVNTMGGGPVGSHPQVPMLQPSLQIKQQPPQQHPPAPAAFMPPQVTALESSQILENSFDSLPNFGQPLMHLPHHAGNSSSPAPPHLNAHSAGGPVSPETHPFLNQRLLADILQV